MRRKGWAAWPTANQSKGGQWYTCSETVMPAVDEKERVGSLAHNQPKQDRLMEASATRLQNIETKNLLREKAKAIHSWNQFTTMKLKNGMHLDGDLLQGYNGHMSVQKYYKIPGVGETRTPKHASGAKK